jgi:hypothetical protein
MLLVTGVSAFPGLSPFGTLALHFGVGAGEFSARSRLGYDYQSPACLG